MSKKKIKAGQHEQYLVTTVIAFLLPFVGFIMGAIFLSKEKELDRKLGEHLMLFSLFVFVVFSLLFFPYFLIGV